MLYSHIDDAVLRLDRDYGKRKKGESLSLQNDVLCGRAILLFTVKTVLLDICLQWCLWGKIFSRFGSFVFALRFVLILYHETEYVMLAAHSIRCRNNRFDRGRQ